MVGEIEVVLPAPRQGSILRPLFFIRIRFKNQRTIRDLFDRHSNCVREAGNLLTNKHVVVEQWTGRLVGLVVAAVSRLSKGNVGIPQILGHDDNNLVRPNAASGRMYLFSTHPFQGSDIEYVAGASQEGRESLVLQLSPAIIWFINSNVFIKKIGVIGR